MNLRVSEENLAKWKAQAAAEHRSLTNFVEFVLNEYLQRVQRKASRHAKETD